MYGSVTVTDATTEGALPLHSFVAQLRGCSLRPLSLRPGAPLSLRLAPASLSRRSCRQMALQERGGTRARRPHSRSLLPPRPTVPLAARDPRRPRWVPLPALTLAPERRQQRQEQQQPQRPGPAELVHRPAGALAPSGAWLSPLLARRRCCCG